MLAFWLVSIDGRLFMTCSMLTKPRLAISSALTTVTGLVAPKPSTVAIREPVTSTSSVVSTSSSVSS